MNNEIIQYQAKRWNYNMRDRKLIQKIAGIALTAVITLSQLATASAAVWTFDKKATTTYAENGGYGILTTDDNLVNINLRDELGLTGKQIGSIASVEVTVTNEDYCKMVYATNGTTKGWIQSNEVEYEVGKSSYTFKVSGNYSSKDGEEEGYAIFHMRCAWKNEGKAIIEKVVFKNEAGKTIAAVAEPTVKSAKETISVGKTKNITLKYALLTATTTYKSSNTKVATVDKDGKIKGVAKGTAKITVAITENGSVTKKTVTVTVK